ncbi:glycogen debranching protein GlgX [Salinimonas sp. HHU 13199]|uniref:Glycogen debranching protein GlgX n=2 Tax=Salinimonas profundi TaxID=2729140 RepID=A0ABR8LGC3_9ALTE|nr:glycogen debranching protein GlgX [Salinimonas profundi]
MQNTIMRQTAGTAEPLGATITDSGVNFAVFSPEATEVILCLFSADTEEPVNEFILENKTGDIWHGHISGIGHHQHYAYRVNRGENALLAAPTDKLLIDPYAKMLSRPIHWNARQYQNDSHFMIPKALVIDERAYQVPRPPKPAIADHQRIIYETHVKGLSKAHPDVPEEQRGKYTGACHPAIIKHLKQLGVTSVQFMPMAAFMPEPYITEKGLTNYWGYNPVSFFAPEPRYAISDALGELQYMVDRYHEAGLEVIADVVFNHTAEGGKGGPVLSFKGFSPYHSYLFEQAPNGELVYSNHSGCGNTVNTASPSMMQLVMDAMRYWLDIIGVDGFRFDLAVSLGRSPQVFSAHSALLQAMRQDPVVKNAVLIAEPWDIGPDGYQLGQFGHEWLEVNDKFRDTVRAFWRGDEGTAPDFATRLMGSDDVFTRGIRPIYTSVNNITYHDGFCLQDLVSYAKRHNRANGEENRDGHGHNLSANYGIEGETKDADINATREQQKRNLFATLILGQGTPHVLGGDELSRTQQGNNNAYCQDNDINWYDWSLNKRKQDFLEFCQYIIALRQNSDLLSHLLMEGDDWQQQVNVKRITWFVPDGSEKEIGHWHASDNRSFALEIVGKAPGRGHAEHWYICFNADTDAVQFTLPETAQHSGWRLKLDTHYSSVREQPELCVQKVYHAAGRTMAIFHIEKNVPNVDTLTTV